MMGVYDSTLRDYLLSSLPENEVEVYDERIFCDDAFAERMLMVEEDLIDAYVRGELTDVERVRFQTVYLASPYHREHVLFAHVFQNIIFEQRLTAYASGAVTLFPSVFLKIFEQRKAPSVLASVTLMDKVKYVVVRFARWAGWLYFVDQDLLDGYIRSYKSRIGGGAA